MAPNDPWIDLWAMLTRRSRKAIAAGKKCRPSSYVGYSITVSLPPIPPRLTLWQRAKQWARGLMKKGATNEAD